MDVHLTGRYIPRCEATLPSTRNIRQRCKHSRRIRSTTMISKLEEYYVVYHKIIKTWQYGDPTHRSRLFIVGFLRELGQIAESFRFPAPTHNEQSCPTMRAIAVPDDEVPSEYWRYDDPTRLPWIKPSPGKMHKIAQSGTGMGHSSNPNGIYSWDCLGNSQTIYNGGGRRPRLDWQMLPDNPIGPTRLPVITETIRMASLPQSYLRFAEQHFTSNCQCATCSDGVSNSSTSFARECINNGIPKRACYAIDTAVMQVLQRLKQRHTSTSEARAHALSKTNIRTSMLDTGANVNLNHTDVEPALHNAENSNYLIQVANSQQMRGSRDGDLTMNVINSQNYNGIPDVTPVIKQVTTASRLGRELFSIDDLYKSGHSILLRRPTFESGIPEVYKPATDSTPEIHIPARYDWKHGGFWIDYTISPDNTNTNQHTSEYIWQYAHSGELVEQLTNTAAESDAVVEVIYGQCAEERNIRGVKAGLRQRKQKMTAKEFHEEHAHLGSQPDCPICKLTKGSMRRIYKVVDKHREQRPVHTFVMDGVVWSDRALCGSKYMVVLRCKATSLIKVIPLYLRNDIRVEIETWITQMRADPAYHGLQYLPVSYIETDRAGEWGRKCKEWQELEVKMKFKTIYKPSDRKEEAANAERACGIVEVVTKSALYQARLPVSWWSRCAVQAEWLLNRFPVTTRDISVPMDGDQARPIELATGGFYSRRQIDRELSYFIPVGTPSLVHDPKAKGSTLGPKSYWAIAVGMMREQVIFWNPYKDSQVVSKSFTAFKLKDMNFAQFLNLPAMPTTRRMAAIPNDFHEKVVIRLPELRDISAPTPRPVCKVKSARLDTNQDKAAESQRELLANEDPTYDTEQKQLVNEAAEYNSQPHQHSSSLHDAPIITTQPQVGRDLRGSVELLDSDGCKLVTDPETGNLTRASAPLDPETGVDVIAVPKQPSIKLPPKHSAKPVVIINNSRQVQQLFDKADALRHKQVAITTGAHDTFVRVCKRLKLPFEKHHLYKEWLIDTQRHPHGRKLKATDLPTEKGRTLPPHLYMPLPTGSKWHSLCKRTHTQSNEDINRQLVDQAEQDIHNILSQQKHSYRATGVINIPLEPTWRLSYPTIQNAYAAKKKRRRINSTSEPANTLEALEGDFYEEWILSCEDEMNGLIKMGVLDTNGDIGGYTRKELINLGITSKPVPIGLYHTHKTGKDGKITRRKTRAAVQGHKGNMQKGVHFTETFAATPNEDTSRFLTCITVALNLKRRSCDIVKAYCWAPVPDGELIALAYPAGYKKWNKKGETLYAIMRQNLYGHPGAARNWQQTRCCQHSIPTDGPANAQKWIHAYSNLNHQRMSMHGHSFTPMTSMQLERVTQS